MIRTSLPINRSLAIFCIFLLLFSNVLSAAAAGAPAQGSFAGASASKSASKQASHQGEIKLPKLPAKSSTKAALPPAVIGSNKAGKNNKEGRNNDGKNNNADTGRNNNAGKNKQGSKDGKAADSLNSPKIQSSKTPPLKTSASPPPLPAKLSSTLPPFSLPTPSSGKPAWSQGSASGSPSSPSGSPSIPPKIPPKQQPGATGLGSLSQPLMLPPPAEEEDNPFAITNVDVSSPVIAGQPFIITIIATDTVHSVDRIAFGTAPYHPENFAVISCPEPVSTTCTISLTRQENSTGSYTYKLLAHNTNGQTAADDITVSVSAEAETSRFILRTAAIDSEAFHASRKRVYLPNTSVTIRDSADGFVLASSPSPRTFSTFSLQSDALYLAEYSSPSYKPDTDVLFFDSRLPSCAGEECTFRSGERQTHCTFSNTKHAYVCELTGGREFSGTVSFEYYPAGDSLGDNVIRYYNHLFPANGPEIADMAPISIVQGGNTTRNLNAFAADPDTPLRELSWTASADHVRATINSRSHVLTVTAPRDFIGNDVVVLTVSDGRNEDTESVPVTVTAASPEVNHVPHITDASPARDSVIMPERTTQDFWVTVEDPDFDDVGSTWSIRQLDGSSVVVASDVLSYRYTAPDYPDREFLIFNTTDDGGLSNWVTWSIFTRDVPPQASFTYSPDIIIAGITDVQFQDHSVSGTDHISGHAWSIDGIPSYTVQNPIMHFDHAGTYNVSLTVTDTGGSSGTTSALIPVYEAPSVSISSPVDGSVVIQGNVVLFSANISDLEDAISELSISWVSDLDGEIGTAPSFTTSSLSLGAHTITLAVTDSHGAVATAVLHVTINSRPTATIVSPFNGTAVDAGVSVMLAVFADDAEDAPEELSVEWLSDKDGVLGSGTPLSISTLSIGEHTITAIVTDSDGASSSAAIIITITAIRINALPTIRITSPVNGSVYSSGSEIGFSAFINDDEDSAGGVSVVWSSSLDGELRVVGGLDSFVASLSPGIHTIIATATDLDGGSAQDTVTVRINTLPEVMILSPTNATVVSEGATVLFEAAASDDAGTPEELGYSWFSSLDGEIGNESTLSISSLQPGEHLVTLSVTDTDGAVMRSRVTIRVNAFPTAVISSPLNGTLITLGDEVTFSASATDAEDAFSELRFNWSSNHDGQLGNGSEIVTSSLSAANHIITLTVTDKDGAAQTSSIWVFVNTPPYVNIISFTRSFPSTGGNMVSLTAIINDTEDVADSLLVRWSSSIDGNLGSGTGVTASNFSVSNLSIGNHTITVNVEDSDGLTMSDSVRVEILSRVMENRPPTVTIDSPSNGTIVNEGENINFVITIGDEDPPSVQTTWLSDRDGFLGTGFPIDASTLSIGQHQITINATDNGGASAAATITIIVNARPRVSIMAPLEGQYQNGTPITFAARINDTDDALSGLLINWTSDINGEFGSTVNFSTGALSIGNHTITLTVTDSNGASDEDVIEIEITELPPPNNAPSPVDILSPANLSSFGEGDPIRFTAFVDDIEDGAAGVSVVWSSDLVAGPLSAALDFTTDTLPAGNHTITLTATDTEGASTIVIILVTVAALPPPNTPPEASILRPISGNYSEGAEIQFAGFVHDEEDDDAELAISWLDSHDGMEEVIGTNETFTLSNLSVGNHTITLAVTDTQELSTTSGPVTIEIIRGVAPNNAPQILSVTPANGSVFNETDTILFGVEAADVEDGESLTFNWTSSLDGFLNGTSSFSQQLHAGNHTITITAADSANATAAASVDIQVLAAVVPPENRPPTVTIDSPSDGTIVNEGENLNFVITIEDEDPSSVQAIWLSDRDGQLGTGFTIDASNLSVGQHQITVNATDNESASAVATITIIVNARPRVSITAPLESQYQNGTPITFTARINDTDDALSSLLINWTSDINGEFGSTANFSTEALSIGNHTITLTVTDTNGASDEDVIEIEITAAPPLNNPPTASITSPAEGQQVTVGDTVLFAADVNDSEDGPSGITLQWISDISGLLGANSSFALSNLSVGNHTITLTVTDRNGSAAVSSSSFTVNPIIDLPPTVSIISPANNTSIQNTDSFTAKVSVTDDRTSTLSCSFLVDGAIAGSPASPVNVSNATITSFTASGLSYASHSWSVECSDGTNTGSSGQSSVRIDDTNMPSLAITSPLNGSVFLTRTVPVRFTITDAESGVNINSCSYRLDGAASAALFSCFGTDLSLAPGLHTIEISARDGVGNSVTQASAFTVDLNGTVSGTVLDNSTGAPIANARVRLMNGTTVVVSSTTSSSGSYILTAEAGSYTLAVLTSGYSTSSSSLAIVAGSSSAVDVRLDPIMATGGLTGTVRDNKNAIYHALVELRQAGSVVATAMTDAAGSYTLNGIREGSYTISIVKEGYTTFSVSVTISPGSVAVADATLVQNSAVAGSLAGTIYRLSDFSAVAGAAITIFISGTTDAVQIVQSGPDGVYIVNGLPVTSTYDLQASAPGLTTQLFAQGLATENGRVSTNNDAFMS